MPELAFKFPTDGEAVRRIYGIEEELATPPQAYLPRGPYVTRDTIYPNVKRLDQFLSNGARLYEDVGQHLEYAAPESQTVRETVAAVIAGELLLTEITERQRPSFKGRYKVSQTSLNTRVIDDEGHTWGSHESYLTRRDIDPLQGFVHEPLASFHATRSLFAGAGAVLQTTDGRVDFRTAQKVLGLDDIVSGTTTLNKALVNTRDQPLADSQEFRRIHIIAGDPTMSPWATAFRLASSSLVLRMIEHGVDLNGLIFKNPLRVAKASTLLPCVSEQFELQNGKKITPLDHQRVWAELVLEFIELVKVPEDEATMAFEWHQAVEDLGGSKDFRILGDRVDWAAKLCVIDEKLKRPKKMSKVQVARGVDHLYGELSNQGIALKMRERQLLRDPLNATELAPSAMTDPPEGRAALRGRFVTQLSQLRRKPICEKATLDWQAGSWKLRERATRHIKMKNPFGDDSDELADIEESFDMLEKLVG